MKYIGIRASAQEIRYAIIEKKDDGQYVFLNQNSENRLLYPATCNSVDGKLFWIHSELARIFRQNPDIEKVLIKMNEYGTENGSKRETAYADAICLLVSNEHHIPVERKLYTQIGATSKTVKDRAEASLGRTPQYWNPTMADAIMAAYWEIRRA